MFFKATVQLNAPRRLDLTIRRNDNPWRARFRLFDADGAPLDMRTYGAKLQLRLYGGMPGAPNLAVNVPVYSYLLGSDGTRRTFAAGERMVTRDAPGASDITMTDYGFDIAIEAADLIGIPAGWEIGEPLRLSYDILITTPSGDENAWFEGEAIVMDGVTRPFSQADRDRMYAVSYDFAAVLAA
jgi:hypothetical protein